MRPDQLPLLTTLSAPAVHPDGDWCVVASSRPDFDADDYVGMLAVAHFYIEQLGLANLQVRQRFDADLSALAVAVSNTQPTLMGILQKAMRFISEEEGKALVRRYLPPGDGIPGVSFQSRAAGVTHPVQSVSNMRRTDARRRERDRPEGVTQGFQLLAQLREIIDSAIERQGQPQMGVDHRLGRAVRQVHDFQAAVAQGNRPLGMKTPGVGASGGEVVGDAFYGCQVGRLMIKA